MLEVTKQPEEQIKYPVGRKSYRTGAVVIFFSELYGVVIDCGSNDAVEKGEASSTWTSCKNGEVWEPVNITITG
ncbi:hypothetical protein [Snodgrassella alvi]|uniref:hypothetical protein n=1 Tax=Snodgrassella alvi TaxID=1196083 RepID=UPI00345FFD48